MSEPPAVDDVAPVLKKRIEQVEMLRTASDSATAAPLADVVRRNLDDLWVHGKRPERIYLRPGFIYGKPNDDWAPAVSRLVRKKGLQLRLELLLLFDAQCRHATGETAKNVRRITPGSDDNDSESWRQLVLAASTPTPGTNRFAAALRVRQITEALRALEENHLVSIRRRKPSSRRREYNKFRLLSEVSRPEERPLYTVPEYGVALSRHFFTNLWVFALSDTELATFLVLSWLRWRLSGKHATQGVFLTAEAREKVFRLKRATWRSTNLLHRFQLIDRMPDDLRDFLSGNVIGEFKTRWASREVMPARFKINDEALEKPALAVIHRVLAEPTEDDQRRRRGVSAEDDLAEKLLFG